ncbi:MAG: hypothetical protein ACPG5P_07685, partial [Saprospiraceae bacterium]
TITECKEDYDLFVSACNDCFTSSFEDTEQSICKEGTIKPPLWSEVVDSISNTNTLIEEDTIYWFKKINPAIGEISMTINDFIVSHSEDNDCEVEETTIYGFAKCDLDEDNMQDEWQRVAIHTYTIYPDISSKINVIESGCSVGVEDNCMPLSLTIEYSEDSISWTTSPPPIEEGSIYWQAYVLDSPSECWETGVVVLDSLRIEVGDLSDQGLCKGDTLRIGTQPSGGTEPYIHSWTSGEIGIVSLINQDDGSVDIVGLNSGDTNVEYTLIDAKGCEISTTLEVEVFDNIVTTIIGDSTVCSNDILNLESSETSSSYTYHWGISGDGSFETLPDSASRSVNVTPNNDGQSIDIFLFITDGNGCKSDITKQSITVNPVPQHPEDSAITIISTEGNQCFYEL